jgi:hypothetical protein
MDINKGLMEKEVMSFLFVLFSLPEVKKVQIKDVLISSIDDSENILKVINECFHDKYSDIDITAYVKLHPADYNTVNLFYKKYFCRLGFQDRILGVLFNERNNNVEFMRICLTSGTRIDFSCHCLVDENAPFIERISLNCEEKNENQQDDSINEWDMENVDSFWFKAILALGKLMRNDYLISSHLSHMLIMESLVAQMVMRDNLHNTNFHRYGYRENLEYLTSIPSIPENLKKSEDVVYNHIAELLSSAVIAYDRLVFKLNNRYNSRSEVFFEIWRSYLE